MGWNWNSSFQGRSIEQSDWLNLDGTSKKIFSVIWFQTGFMNQYEYRNELRFAFEPCQNMEILNRLGNRGISTFNTWSSAIISVHSRSQFWTDRKIFEFSKIDEKSAWSSLVPLFMFLWQIGGCHRVTFLVPWNEITVTEN